MQIANNKVLIKPFSKVKSTKRFFGSQGFDVVDNELVIKAKKRNEYKTNHNTLQNNILCVPDGNTNAQNVVCSGALCSTAGEQEKKIYKLNARKIKRRLYSWFNVSDSKKHLYFLTISFPLHTSDDDIFKYFNVFLTKMRKAKYLRSYLWVSERQKNGTLHFHILINKPVQIVNVNALLRETLINAYSSDNQVFKGYNPINYSGVDLAKDRKTRRVVNFAQGASKQAISYYITKYITKNDSEFTHLCWHCSRDISNLFNYAALDYTDKQLADLLQQFKHKYIVTETAIIYIFETDFVVPEITEMQAFNNIIADSIT